MEQVQLSAIGVAIVCTLTEDGSAVDVSAVTTKQVILKKPDSAGTVVTKTASFTNSGTDGKIQYTTIAGDLDTVGIWQVQGAVIFSGGFNGRSDIQQFEVKPNLV